MKHLFKLLSTFIISVMMFSTFTFAEETRILAFGDNLAFGNVNIGESATQTLTLYNRGNSDLTIRTLRFHNNLQGAFSGNFSGIIPANSEQSVVITFRPTTATSYAGLVYIESDKTNSQDRSKLLRGNGVAGDVIVEEPIDMEEPTPEPTPESVEGTRILGFGMNLNFGEVAVGEAVSKDLILYNRGNSDLTITGFRFHDRLQDAFSGSFEGVIPANSEKHVAITFTPTSETLIHGLVYIESDKTNTNDRTRVLSGKGTIVAVSPVDMFKKVLVEKCAVDATDFDQKFNATSGFYAGSINCANKGLTDSDLLTFKVLKDVKKTLELSHNNLTNLEGLSHLVNVGSGLIEARTNSICQLEESFSCEYNDFGLILSNNPIISLTKLNKLVHVSGKFYVNNTLLTNLDGLDSLSSNLEASLSFSNNPKLLNIDGLHNLRELHAGLDIHSNPLLTNLDALENFTTYSEGAINIKNNTNLTDISGLRNVEDSRYSPWDEIEFYFDNREYIGKLPKGSGLCDVGSYHQLPFVCIEPYADE